MDDINLSQAISNVELPDFIAKLKKVSGSRIKPIGSGSEFYFMLRSNAESDCIVDVVDKKGKTVDVEQCIPRNGNQQRALSLIAKNKYAASDFNPEWDDDADELIKLKEIPGLAQTLVYCDNVVDSKLARIAVSEDVADLCLQINTYDNNRYKTELTAEIQDKSLPNVIFMSEDYILSEQTIYPIAGIGDNFDKMSIFVTMFKTDYIDSFLSLFYTYTKNVKLRFEDYREVFHKTPLEPTPLIYFDKVDEDNALYMRCFNIIGNLPVNFSNDMGLTCSASVDNDQHQINIRPLSGSSLSDTIDKLLTAVKSAAPSATARKQIICEDNLFILPQNIAGNFLLSKLMPLMSQFKLSGIEHIKEYKITPVRPRVNVNFSSGIDYLEGDVMIEIDNEQYTLKDILAQYHRNNFITLKNGNRGVVDDNFIARLSRVFRPIKGSDKVKVSFFDLPEVEALLENRIDNQSFNKMRSVYEGFNDLKDKTMKLPAVKAKLRDYQVEGFKWMNYLRENHLGGCIADDMGLGKTVQTITLLMSIYPKTKKPSLIVMPKSLIFNWQSEIEKFAPKLKYYVYYETSRDLEEAMKSQVILTTYAMVRNDIKDLMNRKFEYVILDESQNIKNVTAQVSQAVKLLNAQYRLALSGTPIENNLTELYSLFSFLNPAMFGTLDEFNQRYTIPIQRNEDSETMKALRKKIYPFMLRRLKKDVLKQLPERIEKQYFVEMSPQQAKFYEERRIYYKNLIGQTIAKDGIGKSQLEMFKALNELRRIASIPGSLTDGSIASPKIEPMMEDVTQAVAGNHKVVIFFNYIAGIEEVGEYLSGEGIKYVTMTGATQNRESVVRQFQNDPDCAVMLMTLKTGGVGLNLTVADIVYIFEPWWNRAAEEQAINRLHRIGQHNTVLSYSMITRGTIEEKICQLQEKKKQLFEGLIGNDSSVAKQLTQEDIDYILS
jgi:superfamily II DNA or RNA helicase